jgi:hypothetical protein
MTRVVERIQPGASINRPLRRPGQSYRLLGWPLGRVVEERHRDRRQVSLPVFLLISVRGRVGGRTRRHSGTLDAP